MSLDTKYRPTLRMLLLRVMEQVFGITIMQNQKS